jgi:hypothetical protein
MKNVLVAIWAGILFSFACTSDKAGDRQTTAKDDRKVPTLKVLEVHPGPVIAKGDPGTEGNIYGFEGGRAHKIDGTYHLFTTEPYAEPHWTNTRLAHWSSPNGIDWERQGYVMQSSGDYTGTDQKAALWSPMTYFLPEQNKWYLSYVAYKSAPDLDTAFKANFEGQIWLAASQTPGKQGIAGPYKDTLMLLGVDENSQEWEGLQGVDSWYPYQLEDGRWLAFYGSAVTQYRPIRFWGVGLAESDSFFGPWERMDGTNPVLMDSLFVENPIVDKVNEDWYIALYDGGPGTNKFAYSYSKDGVNWSYRQYVDLESKTKRWWRPEFGMRTPLGLISEGDGVYTVFFTAIDSTGFGHVGMSKLLLQMEDKQ